MGGPQVKNGAWPLAQALGGSVPLPTVVPGFVPGARGLQFKKMASPAFGTFTIITLTP